METNLHGVVACHVMGSGKTRTAAACAHEFLCQNPQAYVIFVVKRAILPQFSAQVCAYFASYEMPTYRLLFTTFAKFANMTPSTRGNLLVVDEVHYANTHIAMASHVLSDVWQKSDNPTEYVTSGKIPAALLRGSTCAKKVLLLTGTPIINYVHDICNILAMVHGYTYPISPAKLSQMHKRAIQAPGSVWAEALRALFRNAFDFYPAMYPEQETDLGVYFPTCQYEDMCIPMNPVYLQAYRFIEKNMETRARARRKHPDESVEDHMHSAFYVGLRTAANATLGAAEIAAKTEWVANLISREHKNRFVVFSTFKKHGLLPLLKQLNAEGVKCTMVTGDTTHTDIESAVKKYNSHQARVMLISGAGAEGLDLHETDCVVLLESAWNENRLRQAVCRAVRHGSHGEGNKAVVRVVRMYHVKPSELDDARRGVLPFLQGERNSVDLFLKNYAAIKDRDVVQFWRFVKT